MDSSSVKRGVSDFPGEPMTPSISLKAGISWDKVQHRWESYSSIYTYSNYIAIMHLEFVLVLYCWGTKRHPVFELLQRDPLPRLIRFPARPNTLLYRGSGPDDLNGL